MSALWYDLAPLITDYTQLFAAMLPYFVIPNPAGAACALPNDPHGILKIMRSWKKALGRF